MASWTNLPQFQVTTATSITRMDQLLDNIIMSSSHSHTGADGQGASTLGIYTLGTNANQSYIGAENDIFPFLPASLGNWDRVVADGAHLNGGIMKTTATVSASGASIAWVWGRAKSVVRIHVHTYMNASSGWIAGCVGPTTITLWTIGGITASTINLYSATSATGSAMTPDLDYGSSASALLSLRLQVTGKDASSSGYHGGITGISFVYS